MRALSGDPSVVVYCNTNLQAWSDLVGLRFGPERNPDAMWAFTAHQQPKAVYLRQRMCVPLERWVTGKSVDVFQVGSAAQAFTHEAMHVRGIHDEREAECQSLAIIRSVLRTYFGVKSKIAMRDMVFAAIEANRGRNESVRCV